MRPGYDESPLNPVPPVIWALVLPMIAFEAYFGLGQLGFIGGGQPGDLVIHLAHLFGRGAKVLGQIFGMVARIFRRCRGVQFIAVILDLDLGRVRPKPVKRGFQPTLADIAPGAGNIRD